MSVIHNTTRFTCFFFLQKSYVTVQAYGKVHKKHKYQKSVCMYFLQRITAIVSLA